MTNCESVEKASEIEINVALSVQGTLVLALLPQSTQSAGPVGFLILCSISIFLLAS